MCRTVAGRARTKCEALNGRKSRTFTRPTFSPRAFSAAIVSAAVSAADPITTITRSASGDPS